VCIPDPIERLERWEDDMAHKFSDREGNLLCAGCSRRITPGQCYQAGVAPFGVPVCKTCYDQDRLEDE
jgi:hypothetical protein